MIGGADAAASLLSLIGMALVVSKDSKRQMYGYAIWIVSNVLWAAFGFGIGNYWMVAQYAVFLGYSIKGVYINGKDGTRAKDGDKK